MADAEFPSEWHKNAYGDALERELDGAERNIEGFAERLKEAEEQKKNALKELIRIGRRKAEKRPRAKAEEPEKRA